MSTLCDVGLVWAAKASQNDRAEPKFELAIREVNRPRTNQKSDLKVGRQEKNNERDSLSTAQLSIGRRWHHSKITAESNVLSTSQLASVLLEPMEVRLKRQALAV